MKKPSAVTSEPFTWSTAAMRGEPIIAVEPMALTWSSAARALDCSQNKIRQLVRAGLLETIRVGADQRVLVASLRKFVAAGGQK